MNKGGLQVDDHTLYTARTVGLLTPIVLTLYGIIVALGYAPNEHYAGIVPFLVLSVGWIVFGCAQYVTPTRNLNVLVARLVVHHIFAVLYVALVAGFSLAFLSGWALLYLMAYLYLYIPGFVASVSILVVLTLLDSAFHQHDSREIVAMLLNVIGTVLVGVAAISISYLRLKERTELEHSQHREHAERDRIQTIVNNLSDAVISTDSRGIVRIYNAACLGLLDTNKDIQGKRINDVLKITDADGKIIDVAKRLKASTATTIDDSLRMGASNDQLRVELTYAPIRGAYRRADLAKDGNGYILIVRDVTKMKSLEEERDEFISVVSHELRTPVTVTEGLLSNLQLMLKRGTLETDKLDANLSEAHDQVVFLASMINDLSTLSRAERGIADEAEPIDVKTFIHELYAEYLDEAAKQKLEFNLDLSASLGTVQVSRLYLHELLQNFITNALKYTPEGKVTLEVHKKAGQVVFKVHDTGIGISKTDQKKIFAKFYRSEDYRTRETGGTGLGLYVSSKLARKLGTAIELTSRLNHGSTFSISLPEATDKKHK